jgi:hypothetical protein
MKKTFTSLLTSLITLGTLAQTETFDIIKYNAPKNYKKDVKQETVVYSTVDQKTGHFCLIALFPGSVSSGDSEKDFRDKWNELVMTRYSAEQDPKTENAITKDGWKTLTGASIVKQDSMEFYVILTVFSGFGKSVSVMANLDDQSFIPAIDELLDHMKIDKSAKIKNTGMENVPASAESNTIIGTWSDNSISIANYLSPSGAFIGSADVSTMEEYEFKPDNTYRFRFFGSMAGKMYYTETQGTYSANGKKLSLIPKKRMGGYGGKMADEKSMLDKPSTIDWYIGPNKWDAGPYLNLHEEGKYYMWSDYPYNYFKKIEGAKTSNSTNNKMENIEGYPGKTIAASGKFGNAVYSKPADWKETIYSNAVVLSPIGLAENEVLELRLLQPMNFAGTLQEALDKTYNEAVTTLQASKMNDVNGGNYKMEEAKKSFKGWEYIRCSGGIKLGGGDYPPEYGLDLFVIKLNNRFERVAIVKSRNNCGLSSYYPSDRQNIYRDIENFLFSLRFSDWPEKELKQATAKGEGLAGVWEGIGLSVGMTKPGAVLGAELKGMYAIFFSNGQAFFASKFPTEGLDELNTYIEAELHARNWGTYSFSNGKGILKMPYGDIPLRMEKGNLVVTKNKTDHGFVKIPPVDGAKFNGTYLFSSKDITGSETGKTPKINFTPDGKFTDEGAVLIMYHEYVRCLNPAPDKGSGTYVIANNSIVFNYSDGKKIRIAFVGTDYDKNNASPATITVSFNEDVMTKN